MTVDRGRAWRDWAACQGHPMADRWWFPTVTRHPATIRQCHARAIEICRTCPVMRECLAEALSVPADLDRVGVFGGRTPAERAELRGAPGPRLLGAERHAATEVYVGGRAGGDPRRDPQRPRDGDGVKRGQVVGVWLPPVRPVPAGDPSGSGFNGTGRPLTSSPFLRSPRRPKPAPANGSTTT